MVRQRYVNVPPWVIWPCTYYIWRYCFNQNNLNDFTVTGMYIWHLSNIEFLYQFHVGVLCKWQGKIFRAFFQHFPKLKHSLPWLYSLFYIPRPPEVFFATCPPKGAVATPSLDFLHRMPMPVYRYGPLLFIDTKMSTIELHMTSLWRHKASTPSEIWMHLKYTWTLTKINFSLKKVVQK